MKKAFDQTFRDIKRGVNKKVLKVPSIEQKVLDATSNEPWGPHGTHLSDIAQASKNYHEYQMIMTIVWKRLNDTGKNWRHVYKGLTILEYLVANGSERVIEDIREHAYQITSLSAFQYIDSTGRDQGSNVRKKSQLLVALVNDKDKIQEARDKAASSRDKLREDRNGGREEDRNGYGRERECGGEDEYRGRSTSNDGSDNGPRSRSSDRYWEDDGHHSSRGSNARVEDASPDASRLEPKSSGAPPGYEDAMNATVPADTNSNRDGENTSTFTSKPPSPQVTVNQQETPAAAPPPAATQLPPANNENDGFDFFDPRAAPPAPAPAPAPALAASDGAEMDLFGSLSDSFSSNALPLVPSTSVTTEAPPPPANTNPYLTFDTASPGVTSQPFDDPFGDGPFKAIPSATSPFATSAADQISGPGDNLGFGDAFDPTIDILADILPPPGPSSQTATATAFQTQAPTSQNGQPPSFPAETAFSTPFGQPPQPMPHHDFPPQSTTAPQSAFQFPGGQQSMPQPHSDLQAQGSQQSMPPSAFQQSMAQPLSALQVQGQQSMSLSLDFQVPNGQQHPMPQSSTLEQLLGGHQSIPQPSFQVQGGYHQSAFQQAPSAHQSAYQVPGGQQPALQVPGAQQSMPLPVQGGHQSIPQPSFPPQLAQSVMQPGLQSQGVQSTMQPGFASQGNSQNGSLGLSSAGFPTSNGNDNGLSMLQPGFGQSMLQQQNGNPPQPPQNGFPSNVSQPGFINSNGQQNNFYGGGFQPQTSSAPVPPLSQPAPVPHYNPSNFYQQPSLTASTGALALVPQQPTDKKFETKSTVWADTLNRGLVNLNISGSKTNPLSDIGIDFDAINRKEKRMEKPTQKPITSNITMGKAMGSGSGMGRAGAGVLRPAPNPIMAPGMTAPGGGFGMNMGQPMGINSMPQNMGIGMNMMGGQGFPPGGYNPMMGRGQQQPYGGYR